jgi:hypothetical protein
MRQGFDQAFGYLNQILTKDHRYRTISGIQKGIRNVTIDGLAIDLQGNICNETKGTWQPIGLMSVKIDQSTLNLKVNGAEVGGLLIGVNAAKGGVRIE